jgi:hypothetical protein
MSNEKVLTFKSLSSLPYNDNSFLEEESTDSIKNGTTTARSNLDISGTPSSGMARNSSKFKSMKLPKKNSYNDYEKKSKFQSDIEMDDGENYRVRQFNTTKKGTVINRGDSFKTSFRHRSIHVRSIKSGSFSSSNSFSQVDRNSFMKKELDNLVFEQNEPSDSENNDNRLINSFNSRNCISNSRLYSIASTMDSLDSIESYYVYMFGATGVGKSALVKQFETSEYRGIYEIKQNGHNAGIKLIFFSFQ